MIISMIVAASENNAIGKNNELLWHLPADMGFFTRTTKGHVILMGRKNYASIPYKYRPLPERTNIVVTRKENFNGEGIHVVKSIEEGISLAREMGEKELFIIGGGEIYRQSMDIADLIYLTRIHGEFEADTFFPDIDHSKWEEVSKEFRKADERNALDMTFLKYKRK